MIKHAHQYFPSDCFLMLETLGANVVVASASENGKEYKYSPQEWLKISMDKKIIKKFTLPALSQSHFFQTYKVTPRQVHAHAYVNAGFLVRNFYSRRLCRHWPISCSLPQESCFSPAALNENWSMSTRATTLDFWQSRKPYWQPDCRRATRLCHVLFRKVQAGGLACHGVPVYMLQ